MTLAASPVAQETPAGASAGASPAKDLVLLIEDNDGLAALLTTVLAKLGLRVHWCPRGADALPEFARHRDEIALVLADCRLPDADGRAVCATLRQSAPALPMLLCSGNVRCTDLGPLTEDERTAFLPKPYSPSELLGRVRTLLEAA